MKSYQDVFESIAPLWELDRFVAVNPFLGLVERPFAEALAQEEGRTGSPHLPPASGGARRPEATPWRPDTLAALAGPFLASYFGHSAAVVPPPWADLPLYQAWAASVPGSAGLAFRKARELKALVRALPKRPLEVLEALKVAPDRLRWLLDEVGGWSALARRQEWPSSPSPEGPLAALAAILAVLDRVCPVEVPVRLPLPEFEVRLEALERKEAEVRQEVLGQLAPTQSPRQPRVRAAFCIDVRSEPFRRQWEAVDPEVETDGFAGFFGLPLAWNEGDGEVRLLPVLLQPQETLEPDGPRKPQRHRLVTAGTPNFPLVELTGWKAIGPLLTGRRKAKAAPLFGGLEAAVLGRPVVQKTDWAEGILRNLGWAEGWAPVHALIGHGSTSVNNAHGSALDCGACGGRTGEASVRAAAALLNDPETREALRSRGMAVPPTTRFVGGLHDTTLDTLRFFGEGLPEVEPGFRLQRERALAEVTRRTRAEREARFPFLERSAPNRAAQAAETRPEAGLAGNAVFLAVPRSWTRGANLQGRAFLHSYDAQADDGSILNLILTAPVVVASWINLQYFAAAAAPERYGAGNKVLHSRIGNLGVLEGNGGDLKAGLPWQSVGWGTDLYHQPLRLQVMVAAPEDRVRRIVAGHEGLRRLVEGRWIVLSVLKGTPGDNPVTLAEIS